MHIDYREGDIHMSSYWHHILAISPLCVEIYRMGNNRRTVNTSTTPHISDQSGTENACKKLLCWFIDMIRVLVCNNMYQYQHHVGSFYHIPRRFRFIAGKLVNTGFFYSFFLKTTTENNSSTDMFLLRYRMWKSNVKNNFHIISHVGLSEWSQMSNHVVFKFPLTMHTAGNWSGKTS